MRTRLLAALAACTVTLFLAGTATPASATAGQLGGLDLAGYSASLGYAGTTSHVVPVTLTRGAVTGPNFAYANWACLASSGATTPINPTGAAPSMTDACTRQYPGVASYAYPDDANDAFTWNCYSLPPAAGPGVGQQVRAAVDALMANDIVQAEITQLRSLVAARKPLAALSAGLQFLGSTSTQELISDVLGGYHLAHEQSPVTVALGLAMTRAVLNQP